MRKKKLKYYQQQFNELFNDSNNQMLKETITGSQLFYYLKVLLNINPNVEIGTKIS